MSNKEFKLIKLEKDNYVVWKWQFKNVLKAKNLQGALTTSPDGKRNSAEDREAMALLGSALSEENILKIIDCSTFEEAWKAIERNFENKTAYEPQSLYRRLNSFKINSASEVSTGVSEIRGIVAQLKNLNETVSDNCLIGAILSALPSSFNVFITVWKNSADKDVDSLISKLMAEANDQSLKINDEAKALLVHNKPKSNNSKKDKVTKDQCRYCKETGHWIKDCPNLKTPYDPNRGKKKKGTDNKQNDNKDEDAHNLAFMANYSTSIPENMWVADSGSSNHMTPHEHLFSELTIEGPMGSVSLADKSMKQIMGVGEIVTKYGILTDVWYVPGFGQNLFSISAAAEKGLLHRGLKDRLVFTYGDKEVFSAIQKGKIYLIDLNTKVSLQGQANAATPEEWHARFGHVSMDAIKLMAKNNVVDGLNISREAKQVCEDCSLNKCKRVHHPMRTTTKARSPGLVLHVDTAGPSNTVSRGNSKYFVLCKDEFSKYRQVAFVNTKDQIPDKRLSQDQYWKLVIKF